MGSNPGNPPDRWTKVFFSDRPSSQAILRELNNQPFQVTAAFVQECSDGWTLFLGNYKS